VRFEWDRKKAESNLIKHGVSFEEARSVFTSLLSADFPDTEHSHDEERWIKIGPSDKGRLLVVCYVERYDLVRIISVRPATKRETRSYEERKPRD
jgi:uncharacterized DUF497 family protein